MKRTDFDALVMSIAKTQYPTWIWRQEGRWLVATKNSETIRINLPNMYTRHGDEKDVQKGILAEMQTIDTFEVTVNWEDVKGLIYPLLEPDGFLMGVTRQKASDPEKANAVPSCLLPWHDGMCISHVIDAPRAVMHVNDHLLDLWNVSKETVIARARANLAKIPVVMRTGKTRSGVRWAIVEPDTYAATQVILRRMFATFAQAVGPFYHAYPFAQNILYAIEASDHNAGYDFKELSELKRIIEDNVDRTRMFSDGFFCVDAEENTAEWVSSAEDAHKQVLM